MRTVFGLVVVAAVSLAAGPPARGDGYTGWLADGKDELAEGDWDGQRTFEAKPSGGGSQPAAGGATTPPSGTGGGTATPPPEVGGDGSTTDGGGGTEGGAGTTEEPFGAPDGGGDPGGEEEPAGDPATGDGGGGGSAPAPGGSPTPAPAPAPLPSCNAHFVLEEVRADPELVEKETLLTLTLFRNDAFAFISNGYCRSESTWYVDWFTTTSAGHGAHKEYEVEIRLEAPCPNCAPAFDLDGASYLEAKARARSSWGGVSASSSAKAKASTVWSGDLSASDACEASVSNLLTGGEAKLELAGISISGKGTRSEAVETVAGGKGDQATKNQASTRVAVTNKGSVATYAADVENNCQAKSRVGQRMKIVGKSKCGAEAVFELVVVAR